MDSKVLYTNDHADIQCVAVKPIMTVKGASSTAHGGRRSSGTRPQRTPLSSPDEVIFLLPHESFYSYLYIGTADGTLLALRFQVFLQELAVPGGGLTHEHRVALEAQSETVLTVSAPTVSTLNRDAKTRPLHFEDDRSTSPTATLKSVAKGAAEPSTGPEGRGIEAIHAPTNLPYVFLLVHSRFEVHEDDTLQLLDPAYTAPLGLSSSTILCMCFGEDQRMTSRQQRPPVRSMNNDVAASSSTGDESAAVAMDVASPVAYYALLLDNWTVVLAECSKMASTRLAFSNEAAETIGQGREDIEGTPLAFSMPQQQPQRSSALHTRAAETLLPVHPNTSTMAWSGDVLITGSPEYYCLYDTLHGTVLSQLEVTSLLGGCPPYTAYVHSSAVDPTRAGFELAAESAEVCSDLGDDSSDNLLSSNSSSSSKSSESSHGCGSGDSESSDTDIHERRRPPGTANVTGWPSAFVFRLRDGELRVCAGAGRTDLAAAAPLAGAFGAVEEVHSCPPFLLCERSNGGNGGSESSFGDTAITSRNRASTLGLRCTSQEMSAKLAEWRRPAKQCEMILFSCLDEHPWTSPEVEPVSFMSVNLRSVRAFPLGLLGVSRHMVEGLLWKPFTVQLQDQIETGHYARVLRLVSQCYRGSEASQRMVLRQVCQACASRAMQRRRYRVALYFYSLAETGVESLLQLFPELRRPSASTQGGEQGKGMHSDRVNSSYSLEDGRHNTLTPPGAARSKEGNATFAERPSRQFSYSSHAPYRALYRTLISQFFSLVASAATAVNSRSEHPTTGGAGAETTLASNSQPDTPVGTRQDTPRPHWLRLSPNAPPEASTESLERTRATIEFALFCLFVIDFARARRLRTTRDELLCFMVSARTLIPDDCATVITALGLPQQFLLSTMLMAATGDYHTALTRCLEEGDVAAAGTILVMYARTADATSPELEKYYQLHLPWMLEVDPPATLQLLTTTPQFAGEKPGSAVLLPILLTVGGTVLLDYLSYLIHTECTVEASVHELYVTHLVRTLQTLRDEWGLQGFASPELGAAEGAGTETGLVGHLRRALLSFLQCSPYYGKERVLTLLVEADLYEEECVVLEALGDHIGVLSVLVYAMKDMHRAVRYCETHQTQDRVNVPLWPTLADPPAPLLASYAPKMAGKNSGGSSAQQMADVEESQPPPANSLLPLSLSGPAVREPVLSRAAVVPSMLGDAATLSFSASSPLPSARVWRVTHDVVNVPFFPSSECQRVASEAVAAMARDTHESTSNTPGGNGSIADGAPSTAIAPSRVDTWHPMMRFNPYFHMLLHVLLIPPKGNEIALPEVVWLLSTYYLYLDPRLVLSSLPGDLSLLSIAPYLIRAFQHLELNNQLVHIESAAVQSALSDAVRRHLTLQERCVWLDDQRRCVVCGQLLSNGGLVVVFPNLKLAHFRCQQDGTLDPERAVPFFSNVS